LTEREKDISIWIPKLDETARISRKLLKLAEEHDIYSIDNILIPANNPGLVQIDLAIAVPEGT